MAMLVLMVNALPGTAFKEHTREDDFAYAPCDATRLLPNAVDIGDCTAFLRHDATCTQTGLYGYTCFSKCQHGTLVDGRCFQAGVIIDLETNLKDQTKVMTNLWPEPRPRQERVLNAYTPLMDSNIKTAAQLWVSNQASATSTYGLVHTWDLSKVTSLDYVWCGRDEANCASAYVAMRSFNGDISMWDVSKITSMSRSKSIRIFVWE
jgi:hypothetical protein